MASGVASGAIDLSVGGNPIVVTVTAPDGFSAKVYAVTVVRGPGTGGSFEITDITYIDGAPGKLRITWQSEPGTVYLFEQSEDLILWEAFGSDEIGDGALTTLEVDIQGPTRNEFYRAKRK